MNYLLGFAFGASVGAMLSACTPPVAQEDATLPGQGQGQGVPVAVAPTDPQSGIQLGDDGQQAQDMPACARETITDLEVQARQHPLSASEWLETVKTEQRGLLSVQMHGDESCNVELNYELQVNPSDAKVFRQPVGKEARDGQCVSPEEYVAVDVHLTLLIEGRLALTADVEAKSDANAGSTILQHWPRGDWADQFQAVARATLAGLADQCAAESAVDGGTLGAEAGVPAMNSGMRGPDAGTQDAGAFEVPWCTTNLAPDAGVQPVLPDCASCLAGFCGEPDCEADTVCNDYLQCMTACSGDTGCLRACPDPACPTGDQTGCYLLDCRNWGACSEACGYAQPCGPREPALPSSNIKDLGLARGWGAAPQTTKYEGYVQSYDIDFQLQP